MSLPRSPQHACNGLFQHTFDRSPPAWYSAGSHIQNSAKRHGGRAGDIACFIAPAGVAIVTTIVQKVVKNKEEKLTSEHGPRVKGKWTQRLRWLNTMLWGGVALLALEHIWHGEVVPWPPFLTAMQTLADGTDVARDPDLRPDHDCRHSGRLGHHGGCSRTEVSGSDVVQA